jgi:DNA-binding transcriptional regulator YhcF (GntR family)
MELEAGTFCIIPIKAARAAGLSPISGWVLAQLWDHKNREGKCWPSVATLARESCLSRSSVFKALEELERKGFVQKRQRKGEGKILDSNEYLVLIPDSRVVHEADGVVREADHPLVHHADGGSVPDSQRTIPKGTKPTFNQGDMGNCWDLWAKKLGKVPYGRFAKAIREVLNEYGPEDVMIRMKAYLRDTEPRFASPEGFASRYQAYAYTPEFLSAVRPAEASTEVVDGDF